MAVKIQLRRGTASQWTTANPILADGEFGYEKDTNKFKIGDGTTAWSSLAYASTDALFKGVYASSAALASAHPTGSPGEYANVDAGVGNDVELWLWDDDDEEWIQGGSGGPVPDATESVKGIAELATQAETNAGTDARIVTPLKLKNKDADAVAITDASSMDITGPKHTLTTSSATRTFTISHTGDDITLVVTLSAVSSVFTFPTALCVSEGVASGDNTLGLAGASGDKYVIGIKKVGSSYYVVSKNFGQ